MRDLILSALILLAVPGLHYGIDLLIYDGAWSLKYDYLPLLISPITSIIIISFAKPGNFFLTGMAVSVLFTLAVCMYNDATWPRHGLRGLDSVIGSIGAFSVAGLFLIYAHYQKFAFTKKFLWGFISATAGFIVFNQAICNTMIYCGPLSLIHYTQ